MRRFFLCSQNNDSKNYGFYQSVFPDFIAAEFPKTPSPKPARIPPQTPSCGREISRGRANPFPPDILFRPAESILVVLIIWIFARNSFELCPTDTAKSNLGFQIPRNMVGAKRLCAGFPPKIRNLKGFATRSAWLLVCQYKIMNNQTKSFLSILASLRTTKTNKSAVFSDN